MKLHTVMLYSIYNCVRKFGGRWIFLIYLKLFQKQYCICLIWKQSKMALLWTVLFSIDRLDGYILTLWGLRVFWGPEEVLTCPDICDFFQSLKNILMAKVW